MSETLLKFGAPPPPPPHGLILRPLLTVRFAEYESLPEMTWSKRARPRCSPIDDGGFVYAMAVPSGRSGVLGAGQKALAYFSISGFRLGAGEPSGKRPRRAKAPGTTEALERDNRSWNPSYVPNRNILSFLSGPPRD